MHGKSIFLSASGSSVKRNLEKKGLRVFIGSVVCIKFVNKTQNAEFNKINNRNSFIHRIFFMVCISTVSSFSIFVY